MKDLILNALNEKEIFIGVYMLCRYLNGKGYKRYGCNTETNTRINPCKILCPKSNIYRTKIMYWVNKLSKLNLIYQEKILYKDSRNPYSKIIEHKFDVFNIIAKSEGIFNEWKNNN